MYTLLSKTDRRRNEQRPIFSFTTDACTGVSIQTYTHRYHNYILGMGKTEDLAMVNKLIQERLARQSSQQAVSHSREARFFVHAPFHVGLPRFHSPKFTAFTSTTIFLMSAVKKPQT